MTIGIYSLYWEEQDLIYIGQSQNIETRYTRHLYDLKNNIHSNYRVQNAYNNYGLPLHIILEVCSIAQLNDLEIVWQNEFNSLNSLDILVAGYSSGLNNSNSKYTKIQILMVFRLLYSTLKSYKEISSLINVNESLISSICAQRTHVWLSTKYPKLYLKVLRNIPLRYENNNISKNPIYQKGIKVISPDNKEYTITHLTKFCREHPEYIISNLDNLRVGLGKIIRNKSSNYKGWKLLKL